MVSSLTAVAGDEHPAGSLIQISSTVGSSRYCCSGPNPATASKTSRAGLASVSRAAAACRDSVRSS